MSVDITIIKRDGRREPLDITKIQKMTSEAVADLSGVSQSEIELDAHIKFIDGMKSSDIQDALIKTAVEKIDIDVPNWTFVAARLRLYDLYHEVGKVLGNVKGNSYGPLQTTIDYGIAQNRYKKDLCNGFDVEDLSNYIKPERDLQFTYLGIKTAIDKYLTRDALGQTFELPQHLFMMIAMFLASKEKPKDKQQKAKDFYDVISKFEVMVATPTLSGARKIRSQLSSCFIGSAPDNIEGIFDSYKEMSLLSKFGGGIGWDWNEVRCRSSVIDNNVNAAGGTTPWLKITNDIAIAVDQLGCVAKNSWVEILDKVLIVYENGDESIIEMLDNPSNSIREKTIKTFNIDETILYLLDTFGNPSKKYNNDQMLIAIRHYITTGKRENGRESIQNSLNLSKDSTRNLSKLIGKWIENCNFIPDGYKIVNYTDDLSNFICNEYGDIRCRKTLKPVIQEAGKLNHLNVTMNSKNYKSSRIIYFTWSESKNYSSNIDHKDNNKWNNHFNNLCEKTHSENISDGWKETGIENRANKSRIRKHLSLGYQLNGKNTINGKNNLSEISIKEFIYKRIPISKVEKNMFAKSFNIETGKIEPKIVEAVHEMLVKKEDQISLNYKDGSYTITSNWHPTLVFKNGKFIYIRADEVISGDVGVDGLGNKVEYMDSTKPNISENYCDLTVKGNNNYFCVTDKKDGVSHVIHNTRKGAIAVYLEPWHMDIKEFLDLKKNSGEERLRAHDIFPALWINDLFMERVKADAEWTLFDPYQTPELSELYGDAFKTQYLIRENDPKIKKETIRAKDLWKQVLTNYFESGNPFLCFKDTANRANPNSHVGHIRSSNLCTEIFQNTSPNIYSVKAWVSEDEYFIIKEGELALTKNEFLDDPYIFGKQLTVGDIVRGIVVGVNEDDKSFNVQLLPEEYQKPIYALEKECHEGETAVCNLASINLSRVNTKEDIERVTKIAINMLDNVVDLNFYPTKKAKDTNLKSRAVGLGVMGEAEMLASKGIMFGSQEHFEFIDDIMEVVSFNAIKGSAEIAVEKGSYPNFDGSAWSEGILPIDRANANAIELTKNNSRVYSEEEYNKLRESVRNGMRNGYLMAIAPTSSISILVGTTQAIEPIYKKKFFEENMSGLIPVVAPKLSPETWNYYPSAFDIEQMNLIKAASVRQKWIDQGQSTNVFMRLDKASGKYLNDIYMLAWEYGLKSTYYLRSQSPEAKKESDDVVDRSIECMGCQ